MMYAVLLAAVLLAEAVFLVTGQHRRSWSRLLKHDKVALLAAGGWWIYAFSTSWVNDGDPLGGAVIGLLGALIVGSLVAVAHGRLIRWRESRTSS
ncbi:hypothetical protein [Streptomyces huasconensis]|uniref:hypothetical protein n=1 Tax=Streptomyces huasconensis TaxID=1854574 RepID=UPI0036FD4B65